MNGDTLTVGTLVAAIVALFGLLVQQMNARATSAEARATKSDEATKVANDKVEETWRETAALLAESNTRMAEITKLVIEQRRSTLSRS